MSTHRATGRRRPRVTAKGAAAGRRSEPTIDVEAELVEEEPLAPAGGPPRGPPATALALRPDARLASVQAARAHARARAAHYDDAARAGSTRHAYDGDWARFKAWAAALDYCPLPAAPEHVGEYIATLADRKQACSTIDRVIAAIGYFHKTAKPKPFDWFPGHPAIARPRRGIRRTRGVAQRKKRLLTDHPLVRIVEKLSGPKAPMWLAILTVAFWAALRRSEVQKMLLSHVRFEMSEGVEWLVVHLPERKTDQEKKGEDIAMVSWVENPTICPVRAMHAWLDQHPGGYHVFPCSDRAVARLVQRLASKIGFPAGTFGGHSLRAGFITTAAGDEVPMDVWMRQSGHTSTKVAMGYIRPATMFKNNATAALARKRAEEKR